MMIFPPRHSLRLAVRVHGDQGTILILTLMITLGLVAVTLYFADSMMLEYRASDNEVSGLMAGQAGEGARRYLVSMLQNNAQPGQLPIINTNYRAEAVPVGDETKFWLIGRDPNALQYPKQPVFGLVDEASKINVNMSANGQTTTYALQAILGTLPGMNSSLAANIIAWRSAASQAFLGGVESSTYEGLSPPYQAKNALFETPEELRLIYGITWPILYGEDANRNGVLDPNEDDGSVSPPMDNHNGILEPGIIEYVTCFSKEPNHQANGSARVNVRNMTASGLPGQMARQQRPLLNVLTNTLGASKAQQYISNLSASGISPIRSVLEFYIRSQMLQSDFVQIEDMVTVFSDDPVLGLINVNTASQTVLTCLGLTATQVTALIAGRGGQTATPSTTISWLYPAILDRATAIAAGPYITVRSYQFSADVVSLGRMGRGMRRDLFVIDTASGTPQVIYHRDLGRLGWPLGVALHEQLRFGNKS